MRSIRQLAFCFELDLVGEISLSQIKMYGKVCAESPQVIGRIWKKVEEFHGFPSLKSTGIPLEAVGMSSCVCIPILYILAQTSGGLCTARKWIGQDSAHVGMWSCGQQ